MMPLACQQLMRARKFAAALRHRRWWHPLRLGVAPSLEFSTVDFAFDHRTVIDVGAGRGQFALFARDRFPEATVYALEPGRNAFATLSQVHTGDALVRPIRVAVGDQAGGGTLHVTADSDSSSLLPLGQQPRVFPGSDEVRTEEIEIARLDDVLPGDWPRPALLKIDVQGAELRVLRGATRTLGGVDEVLVEVSFRPLYVGQDRADAVVRFLGEHGFRLVAEHPAGRDKRGHAVQADVRFIRQDVTPASTG